MTDKKVIIGICSYAGSDTLRIVEAIQRMLLHYSIVARICSAKEFSSKKIKETILGYTSSVAIVYSITSLRKIEALKKQLKNQTFETIGIEVPREDCFKALIKTGRVGKRETQIKWYAKFDKDPTQIAMRKCFDMLEAQGLVFKCDDGSFNERVGQIVDYLSRDLLRSYISSAVA